jgi:hypothetical protein
MIISHEQEFIFVKTGGTGGSQLELTLAPYLSDEAIQTLNTVGGQFPEVRDQFRRTSRLPLNKFSAVAIELVVDSSERRIALKGIIGSLLSQRGPYIEALSIEKSHMSASEIRDLVGIHAFQKYFKVSLVRNPYNRIASAFWRSSLMKGSKITLSKLELREVFFKWLSGNTEVFSVNRRILTDVDNPNGGELLVDRVIRYENLETSLTIFEECLKVDVDILTDRFRSFPARNNLRPKNISVTDLYSSESMRLVRQLAAWEFISFGYDPSALVDDV